MNADSIFIIGATHSVCQDYAIAQNSSLRNPYIVLSDGCSTSPYTDFGARLLMKAVAHVLNSDPDEEPTALPEKAARLALSWATVMDLPLESVDATLFAAYIAGDELLVSCSGDGMLGVEANDGALDVYTISYPSGYPFYPAYLHQPDRLKALLSNGPSKELKHYRGNSGSLNLESTTTVNETTQVFRFKISDYKFVAMVSDGIHSFVRTDLTAISKRVEGIPATEVIRELLAFKSLNGAFVARRVKRFLKDCQAKGWQHTDDLSLAAIYLGGSQCSPDILSRV